MSAHGSNAGNSDLGNAAGKVSARHECRVTQELRAHGGSPGSITGQHELRGWLRLAHQGKCVDGHINAVHRFPRPRREHDGGALPTGTSDESPVTKPVSSNRSRSIPQGNVTLRSSGYSAISAARRPTSRQSQISQSAAASATRARSRNPCSRWRPTKCRSPTTSVRRDESRIAPPDARTYRTGPA